MSYLWFILFIISFFALLLVGSYCKRLIKKTKMDLDLFGLLFLRFIEFKDFLQTISKKPALFGNPDVKAVLESSVELIKDIEEFESILTDNIFIFADKEPQEIEEYDEEEIENI